MSALEEFGRKRIDIAGIVFKEFATGVDDDLGLVWHAGFKVVLHCIVGEVIEDFEREKVARRRDVDVPVEDAAIDNFYLVGVASRVRGVAQTFLLQVCQLAGDFDNLELCPLVHFRVYISYEVQNVQHHGSVARAHLVYIQVVIRVKVVLVVFDEVPRNRFAIVGREELGRSMPELAQVIWLLVVEFVFEGCVAVPQLLEEVML